MRWVMTFSVARREKECDPGGCRFAVWAPTSRFARSPLWETQILFVSTQPVTVWHLRSAAFSKGEPKSLPPASRREKKKALRTKKKRPRLSIVLETERGSGWVLGFCARLCARSTRICGTQTRNNGGLKVIQRWDGRRKSGGVMSLSALPEVMAQVKFSRGKVHAESYIGVQLDHMTFYLI